VILVGEMRDLETISFAVTAAETGHLVFGTVHTASADTSVDRLINAFPPGQQPQVRSMLAETLQAVVCQHLVRKKEGGRVLVAEVLINNEAVSNLIRKGKTYQIPSVVTTSRELGMQSMDMELARLVNEGVIALDEGYSKANDKRAFEQATGTGDAAPGEKREAPPPVPPQAKAG
jgi:twitching motility protein PilT